MKVIDHLRGLVQNEWAQIPSRCFLFWAHNEWDFAAPMARDFDDLTVDGQKNDWSWGWDWGAIWP